MDTLSLLSEFLENFASAKENLYEAPERFAEFEKTTCDLSHMLAAGLLAITLEEMDRDISDSSLRKKRFTVQRHRKRTLISSVGDITFERTMFWDTQENRYRCILDEILKVPSREKLTSFNEALMLSEAAVHSYQHAADAASAGAAKVSKTTVMNKVHAIEEELPETGGEPLQKKKCSVLYVEADEDHIHRQKDKEHEGCMIGKLAYVFEGKEDLCNGRRALVEPHYFAGLYEGKDQNQCFWDNVERYIEDHYDMESLERIYLISDGGTWIQTGVDTLYKCKAVIDKFHVMKYINRASNLAGEKADECKQMFYRHIYKNRKSAVRDLINRIGMMHPGEERAETALNQCLTYFENNWKAIHLAYANKDIPGSSTEGHVSHVLSERMSSRPMGWSEVGSDRMCKLRCYIKNNGAEKVLNLVKAARVKECQQEYAATGTEGLLATAPKRRWSKEQREAFRYVECIQTNLESRFSARKKLAIRTHLSGI